jgi:hypothetical protein
VMLMKFTETDDILYFTGDRAVDFSLTKKDNLTRKYFGTSSLSIWSRIARIAPILSAEIYSATSHSLL